MEKVAFSCFCVKYGMGYTWHSRHHTCEAQHLSYYCYIITLADDIALMLELLLERRRVGEENDQINYNRYNS